MAAERGSGAGLWMSGMKRKRTVAPLSGDLYAGLRREHKKRQADLKLVERDLLNTVRTGPASLSPGVVGALQDAHALAA